MKRLLRAFAATLIAIMPATAQQAPSQADALAAWDKAFAVFSHPRCANCHVATDRPAWTGGHYKTHVHAFNVQRGPDGFGKPGMRCTTCHAETNSPILHGPPGAPTWHLAPVEMVWLGQSSAAICAQIKDPVRNGGRTLDEIAIHVRDDKLVGWGWAPGPGREPAPGSAQATFEALRLWTDGGAPCPQP